MNMSTISTTEPFSARLKRLRISKGYTVKELSGLMNVPQSTYRDWEAGGKITGTKNLVKITEVLEISLTELIVGETKTSTVLDELDEIIKKVNFIKMNLRNHLQ